MGKDRTQPGCKIDASLWSEFREEVRQRRGRINGVLASELENALRAYLDGSDGGDVTDELRRLREDVDDIADAVATDGGDASPGRSKKEKNSSRHSKDSHSRDDAPVSDGGLPVDDRELTGEGQADDRSVVERRTDGAVAELVANYDQFQLSDLDDAIESGAGVASKPSVKKYRKRVFDRLGGKDVLVHPNHRSRPLDRQVFFVDDRDARIADANQRIERGATLDDAAEENDLDAEELHAELPGSVRAALRVRTDGLSVEDASAEEDTDPMYVRESLPPGFDPGEENDGDTPPGGGPSESRNATPVTNPSEDSVAENAGFQAEGDD